MKLFYWRSLEGNFGDDLNPLVWPSLLPGVLDECVDALVFGIGSILGGAVPRARYRVVLGSGAGVGPPPRDASGGTWRIYALRGPLTARALGVDPVLAVTDPAVLLPLVFGEPGGERTGTVFVPHWTSASRSAWRDACAVARIGFVDPRGDARAVVRAIANARLVIAESMHAAIVADAFRVPWVPVVLGRSDAFKWHDWTASIGLAYRPLRLGPLGLVATLRSLVRPSRAIPCADVSLATLARSPSAARSPSRRWTAARARLSARLDRAARPLLAVRGARLLARAERASAFRSDDGLLVARQEELLRRIDAFRGDHASGRFDRAASAASRPT